MACEVRVTVDGETVWVGLYKRPERAAEYWRCGDPPRSMLRRVARALQRNAKKESAK